MTKATLLGKGNRLCRNCVICAVDDVEQGCNSGLAVIQGHDVALRMDALEKRTNFAAVAQVTTAVRDGIAVGGQEERRQQKRAHQQDGESVAFVLLHFLQTGYPDDSAAPFMMISYSIQAFNTGRKVTSGWM
jgi:hypothetical protein